MWERFFNWQSDMDWAWGPLLPLRPPRDTAIRPWVWVRLFLAFTIFGLLLLALGVFLCVMLPQLAAAQHRPLPPLVSETLSTLQAMGADPGTRALFLGLLLSLPLLFFTFCLPYHWAWNRRAARFQTGEDVTEPVTAREGVWPPAPKEAPTPSPSPAGGRGEPD
jgi:hypothetical protein